jgi:hypothetical protein
MASSFANGTSLDKRRGIVVALQTPDPHVLLARAGPFREWGLDRGRIEIAGFGVKLGIGADLSLNSGIFGSVSLD